MVHFVLALALVLAGGQGQESRQSGQEQPPYLATAAEAESLTLEIESSSFRNDSLIPGRYTCDGEDVSPHLSWSGVPQSARSLALVCDDPDAPGGTWVHWIIYDMPADLDSLPEAVPTEDTLWQSAKQGMTSFKRVGYGGPCPPEGKPHKYYFRVYALDALLELESGKTKDELLRAMKGHIVARGQLMGRYGR